MSANINSRAFHMDPQGLGNTLYLSTPAQFSEVGTLMNQGNWSSPALNKNLTNLATPMINGIGGLLGMGYGGYLTKQGIDETVQAAKCGDKQGLISGSVNTGVGITFVGMSTALCANGIVSALPILELSSINTSESLIKIFTTAMNWLGLALYTLYIGGSLSALPELRNFRHSFNEMLHTQRMSTKTKALEGLRFIESQISLTEQEKAELSQMPPECVRKKLEHKWDKLVRCVGLECAKKIEQELPGLFKEVSEGKFDHTEKLLAAVSKGNFKQTVTQIAMLAAGIIGVIGSVLALAAIGGYATFALFAVSSVLYWLNGVMGDIAYKIWAPPTDLKSACFNPQPAI